MTSSLVGSEMCIRDSLRFDHEGLPFDSQQLLTMAVAAKNTLTIVGQYSPHAGDSGLSARPPSRHQSRRRSRWRRDVRWHFTSHTS
eukprot:4950926-Prorocentrum_lima.AAC.1